MSELATPLRGALQPAPHHPGFDERDVIARDDTPLVARFYSPAPGLAARGAVLIVPAMGVPQSYYAAFARWLASDGFHVATFDYRGMGLSRRGSLRGLDADITVWAELDTQAVLDALASRTRGLPLTWIGHSLGGQILPFVRERAAVTKVITVAAGSGYWRSNSPELRRKVWMLWWGVAPIATPLFGYFPGKRLGMVGDLPRGVIEQWRRWCLDPEYALGDGDEVRARFAEVDHPMTCFSFTDDEMMSADSIASLHSFYLAAQKTHIRLAPLDLGFSRVGHFGFFREEMRDVLWRPRVWRELATVTAERSA